MNFHPVSALIVTTLTLTLAGGGCSGGAAPASTASTAPAAPSPVTPSASRTLLAQSTLYPRLVRLSFGPAATNGRILASTNGVIFQSTDNGVTFTLLGTVPTQSGSTERCCATLYEIPQAVGSLPAGTLISAGSYFSGSTPAIELYISADQGHTWVYNSTPVKQGGSNNGLWEPEFEIASDGALVMFWSDETDACCSQKLAQMRTYDGATWKDTTNTVASTVQADRPGMARVSRLPNGHFFLSYELCGPAACTVFAKTSTDGWNFGPPASVGTKIVSTTGQYLEHAPANFWSPSSTNANGSLLLVGQVLYESTGAVSPQNGQVLFVNSSVDGAGPWSTIAAPVLVPTAYDNYCPNYSSALLPSIDGSTVLEMASDYNSSNSCMTYYATGSAH